MCFQAGTLRNRRIRGVPPRAAPGASPKSGSSKGSSSWLFLVQSVCVCVFFSKRKEIKNVVSLRADGCWTRTIITLKF